MIIFLTSWISTILGFYHSKSDVYMCCILSYIARGFIQSHCYLWSLRIWTIFYPFALLETAVERYDRTKKFFFRSACLQPEDSGIQEFKKKHILNGYSNDNSTCFPYLQSIDRKYFRFMCCIYSYIFGPRRFSACEYKTSKDKFFLQNYRSFQEPIELQSIWQGKTNSIDWNYKRHGYPFRVYIYINSGDGTCLFRSEIISMLYPIILFHV
jgi:hypothetical protein